MKIYEKLPESFEHLSDELKIFWHNTIQKVLLDKKNNPEKYNISDDEFLDMYSEFKKTLK